MVTNRAARRTLPKKTYIKIIPVEDAFAQRSVVSTVIDVLIGAREDIIGENRLEPTMNHVKH